MKIATFMLVVTNLWEVKMENCTAWKSGRTRKSSLNLVMNQANAKEEGRVKLKECFRSGCIGHIRAGCRAKTHTNGGPPKSAPKKKSVGKCEDEETETSQNVPLGTIDLGFFEVLSDHGEEVDGDESTFETTELLPPLPLDSRFNRTETLCWKFRKPGNEDAFLDCWNGEQEQFDVLPASPEASKNRCRCPAGAMRAKAWRSDQDHFKVETVKYKKQQQPIAVTQPR